MCVYKEKHLPVDSDIFGHKVSDLNDDSVTLCQVDRWTRKLSVNCDSRFRMAEASDIRVLNLPIHIQPHH